MNERKEEDMTCQNHESRERLIDLAEQLDAVRFENSAASRKDAQYVSAISDILVVLSNLEDAIDDLPYCVGCGGVSDE